MTEEKRKYGFVNFRLEESLLEALKERAYKNDCSLSEIIRIAILRELSKDNMTFVTNYRSRIKAELHSDLMRSVESIRAVLNVIELNGRSVI